MPPPDASHHFDADGRSLLTPPTKSPAALKYPRLGSNGGGFADESSTSLIDVATSVTSDASEPEPSELWTEVASAWPHLPRVLQFAIADLVRGQNARSISENGANPGSISRESVRMEADLKRP